MGCNSSNTKDNSTKPTTQQVGGQEGSEVHTKPIIVVTGATGAQGGWVVRSLVKNHANQFSVRALTRNLDSDKAKDLKTLGVEVVKADYGDLPSLEAAFNGAHGVFCVTNFWEVFSAEKEKEQASNLAKACKTAGVKHVIWSTLEDSRDVLKDKVPIMEGKYTVPHFDGKFEANEYFKDLPTTYLYTSVYFENFIGFGMGPKKGENGYSIHFNMEDVKFPMIAIEDIGNAAANIFARGNEFVGKSIGLAGDFLNGTELAELFSKHLKIECNYVAIDDDSYRKLGFPGADEIGNMFAFFRLGAHGMQNLRNLEESRKLVPGLRSFENWLGDNGSKIPL